MADVVVVGAGLGGLASAVVLASRGLDVVVVEAADHPGGKAAQVTVDGVSFDTGPSVLTLPGILRGLLEDAGVDVSDVVTLTRPEPAFRYLWPDGTELDVFQDPADTEASVRDSLGPEAAEDFAAFMAYSRDIWEAASPHFILAGAPSVGRIAGLGLTGLSAVSRIDAMRSMQSVLEARVRSSHLRDLFARFATYNGSDPRRAPATLHCIAHVEMALGAHGVSGGIHQLPLGLERAARSLGAAFRFGTPIEAVEVDGRAVTGVRLRGGERIAASRVVVNADVAHLVEDLLPPRPRHGLKVDTDRSTSGWTAVVRRKRTGRARVSHTAYFNTPYLNEFRDLFDRRAPPEDPTVYVCDQGIAHERPGWEGADPVFIMANAPAEPAHGQTPAEVWERLETRVWERLREVDLVSADDTIVWRRSPAGLAERFAGSRGSLYGAASNTMFAAFQRPPNRLRRPAGLYLASGSAHPGGGMPLCLQSGRLAADELLRDLGGRG